MKLTQLSFFKRVAVHVEKGGITGAATKQPKRAWAYFGW